MRKPLGIQKCDGRTDGRMDKAFYSRLSVTKKKGRRKIREGEKRGDTKGTRPDTRQSSRGRLGRSSNAKTAWNSKMWWTDGWTYGHADQHGVYPRLKTKKKSNFFTLWKLFNVITAKVIAWALYNLLRISQGVGWSFMQNFRVFPRILLKLH